MKKLTFKSIVLIALTLLSCSRDEPGTTVERIHGAERGLPKELEGLKVYWVATSGGGVNVAILDGKINSTTHLNGKQLQSTILINKQSGRIVEFSQVLLENDSIIVCRK